MLHAHWLFLRRKTVIQQAVAILMIISLFLTLSVPVHAETLVIKPAPEPSKDTTISSYMTDSNYEDNAILSVGRSLEPSFEDQILIQFDLAESPITVNSAKLQLVLFTSEEELITVHVHQVTSAWDVETVTWNTKPTYSPTVVDSTVGGFNRGSVWEWDVTDLYHAWKSGAPNYGMVLIADALEPATIVNFYESHSESPEEIAPRLVLEYSTQVTITHTVTFDSRGGTPVAESIVEDGEPAVEPDAPTRTGYVFGGWFKEAAAEDDWDFAVDIVTADKTLYAKWVPIDYSIDYYLDGGTNHADNPATYTIESPAITFKDPGKADFTFKGWYDAATDGNAVTGIPAGHTGNISVYAVWEAVSVVPTTANYHVEYYKEDTIGHYVLADTVMFSGTIGETVTAPTKTYAGFTENETHSARLISGVVTADGNLVLKRYYQQVLVDLPVTGETSQAPLWGILMFLLAGALAILRKRPLKDVT